MRCGCASPSDLHRRHQVRRNPWRRHCPLVRRLSVLSGVAPFPNGRPRPASPHLETRARFHAGLLRLGAHNRPEVTWTIPHQASKTGLGIIPKLAQAHPDQVVNILEHTGNCISASIPMGLHAYVGGQAQARGHRHAQRHVCGLRRWILAVPACLVLSPGFFLGRRGSMCPALAPDFHRLLGVSLVQSDDTLEQPWGWTGWFSRSFEGSRSSACFFVVSLPRTGTTNLLHGLTDSGRINPLALWESLLAPSVVQKKVLRLAWRVMPTPAKPCAARRPQAFGQA